MTPSGIKVTATVEGVARVTRALRLRQQKVRAGVQRVVAESTAATVAGARARVPVDSGELQRTIRGDILPNGLVAFVRAGFGKLPRRIRGKSKRSQQLREWRRMQQGPQTQGVYAMVIEYGAKNKPAQPYMRPALQAVRPGHLTKMRAALRKGVEGTPGGAA